jgi:hypothetical protein
LKEETKNIYITSDEEIKEGDCCIENGMYISNGVPHQYQILIQRRNQKNHPNNRPKLNQRECKPLMMSFWVVVKNPSCEEVEVLHQDVILWVNGIESNISFQKTLTKQKKKDMFELEQELLHLPYLRFPNS